MHFLPEDIIISHILPRLHVKTLFKFKCVSKQYDSIISSPKLAQHYLWRAYTCRETWFSLPGHLWGLLLPLVNWSFEDRNIKDLNDDDVDSSDDRNGSIHLYSVSLPVNDHDESHKILFSSNGLILSLFYPNSTRYCLCVSNPLTKQYVQLPYPMTFTKNTGMVFFLATRRCGQEDNDNDAFLSYKVMIIDIACLPGGEYAKTATIESFSSDTGTWVTREVSCPIGVSPSCIYSRAKFSHNGILYWLNCERGAGAIITYNPFDSPNRFGHIPLPNELYGHSSLIYSGDHEAVKLCDIKMKPESVSNGEDDCLRMWRLVEGSKWYLERDEVNSVARGFSYRCPRSIMVAPNPRNSHLICIPSMRNSSYTILNFLDWTWKVVNVDLEATLQRNPLEHKKLAPSSPVIPIQFCPWSSPYHRQNILN